MHRVIAVLLLLVAVPCVVSADAVVDVVGPGGVTGIRNLSVGGTLYDVDFVFGDFVATFGGHLDGLNTATFWGSPNLAKEAAGNMASAMNALPTIPTKIKGYDFAGSNDHVGAYIPIEFYPGNSDPNSSTAYQKAATLEMWQSGPKPNDPIWKEPISDTLLFGVDLAGIEGLEVLYAVFSPADPGGVPGVPLPLALPQGIIAICGLAGVAYWRKRQF